MKVFKPLDLALLTKVFEWNFEQQFVATAFHGFDMTSGESILESDLWRMLGEELGKDVAFDLAMPKPKAEVLVYGSYYSPTGQLVTADRVGFRVGQVSKELSVIGDRYWRPLIGPTPPEPFTELSITYDNAFGGEGYGMNPTGKGFVEVTLESGETATPLPNIEHPDKLITSASDRPEPEGFRNLDVAWQQRMSRTGTYDQKWINERAPAYPADLDWTHFNATVSNQWSDDFFVGGESFEIANMHPKESTIKGSLPRTKCRCFIDRKDAAVSFDEIDMRIDTVCLFPSIKIGILVYRGTIKVENDDTSDIDNIVLAYESLDEAPRSVEHYRAAMDNRLDPDKKLKYMMTTKDFIPAAVTCGLARILAGTGDGPELALLDNMQAKAEMVKKDAEEKVEAQKALLSEQLVQAGLSPDEIVNLLKDKSGEDPFFEKVKELMNQISPGLADGERKIDFEKLDLTKIDDLKKLMEDFSVQQRGKIKNQLSEEIVKLEQQGSPGDAIEKLQSALVKIDRPPVFMRADFSPAITDLKKNIQQAKELKEQLTTQGTSAEQLEKLDLQIDFDEIEGRLKKAEIKIFDAYRMGAHSFIKGIAPHFDTMKEVKTSLLESLESNENVSHGDYAGLDLTDCSLAGKDLSFCYLEDVNLSNVDLSGCNLSHAILAHSNLQGANLTGANLENANMGAANLSGADLTDCNTEGLLLSGSRLDGTKLHACKLSGTSLFEASLQKADFKNAVFTKAVFIDQDLTASCFDGADLTGNVFLDCMMPDSSFKAAKLGEATFVNADLSHADFTDANMPNSRFVSKCRINQSKFVNANIEKSNLREAELVQADFTSANIDMTDFGEANLQKAIFNKATGLRPQFIGADLAQANLSNAGFFEGTMLKARLTSADLSNSNFYNAEFMSATVGDTDFSGSILAMTKLKDWRPTK